MNEEVFGMIVDVLLNMFIVVSVISTIFFLYIMHITKMLHSNLKFTLMFLSIVLRLMTVTRAIADLAFLIDSSANLTYYICRCMSFFNLFCMGFVQLSFAALVIERAMATIYHANYELWGNMLAKALTGMFMVNASVFCVACFLLDTYGVVKEEQNFPTCVVLFKCPIFVIYSWSVFGLTMMFGAGPIVWLYYYNKKMCLRRGQGTLTTRYQYHDNVVVLRIYAPVIVFAVFGIGFLCLIIIFTAGVQLLNHQVLEPQMYTLFKTRRPRETIKGNVLLYRDKTISTTSEYSSMAGRLSGSVNVSILVEGETEIPCVLYFEADDSPHKRLRSVHQLVHRLNRQNETSLGTLICGTIMPPKEAEITHECPRGRISDTEQSLYFSLYEYAGITLSEFVRTRPTQMFSIEIATKTLQSLYTLHSKNYCHGKLTPSSFFIDEATSAVCLIDLGLFHPMKDKSNCELYYIYSDINFDPLYQSAVSHFTTPPSVMSDLESWSYIFVQMLVGKPLPWSELQDKVKIQELKVQFTRCNDPFRIYTKDLRSDMVHYLRDMYSNLISAPTTELGGQLTVKYQALLDCLAQLDGISGKRRLGEDNDSNQSPATPPCNTAVSLNSPRDLNSNPVKDEGSKN